MHLSEHFTLGEVTKTSHQTADKNIPSRVASATASAAIGSTSPSALKKIAERQILY